MRKRIAAAAVAIIGAVAGMVGPALAHPTNLAAPADVVTLTATLTGTYVYAPAAGSGTAAITFAGNRVCWKFTFKGIGAPTISGIHKAPPPPAGLHKTAIIPFTATTTTHKGCAEAKAGAVKVVLANPSVYYVSIGTSGKYRFAAIGGRLHKR
jgi:CHRD domain